MLMKAPVLYSISIMKNLLLPCLLIILLLEACGKKGIPTESTYTFINRTGEKINLDMYGSKADYEADTNRLAHYIIMPDSSRKMVLEMGKTYWMDWYSDDYSVNNWQVWWSNPKPGAELNVADVDQQITMHIDDPDTVRSVLLNGSTSTLWSGIVARGDSFDGTHSFLFKKDYQGIYKLDAPNGTHLETAFRYIVNGVNQEGLKTGRFTLYLRDMQGISLFGVSCHMNGWLPSTGRDSLLIEPLDGYPSHMFNVRRQ